MQTLCECHERACEAATDLRKTLASMGNDEPILAGRGSGRNSSGTGRFNGTKNTAKLIEAKQNWINMDTTVCSHSCDSCWC